MRDEPCWWANRSFRFVRLPLAILRDPQYAGLSAAARLLYGVLLERTILSAENSWMDAEGRVFVYCNINDVGEVLSCGHDKATRTLRELERAGLLYRQKQRLCNPDRLYVLPFSDLCDIPADRSAEKPLSGVLENRGRSAEKPHPECGKAASRSAEKPQSGVRKSRSPECGKAASNNTEYNNTEKSDTEKNNTEYNNTQSNHTYPSAGGTEGRVKEQIGYEALITIEDENQVDEIVRLMTDVLDSSADTMRINGEALPMENVRARFGDISFDHIQYVLLSLRRDTVPVRNIRSYLLTALYNAPATMALSIDRMVREDNPDLR